MSLLGERLAIDFAVNVQYEFAVENNFLGNHVVGNEVSQGRLYSARGGEIARFFGIGQAHVGDQVGNLPVAFCGKDYGFANFGNTHERLLHIRQFHSETIELHLEIESSEAEKTPFSVYVAFIACFVQRSVLPSASRTSENTAWVRSGRPK